MPVGQKTATQDITGFKFNSISSGWLLSHKTIQVGQVNDSFMQIYAGGYISTQTEQEAEKDIWKTVIIKTPGFAKQGKRKIT